MKSYDRRLSRMNASLLEFFEELKDYSDDTLNRKPDEDAWSVLQVMDHLIQSESISLQAAKRTIAVPDKLQNAGIGHFFRYRLLRFYLRSPMKFQAPDSVGTSVLLERGSFWEVARRWRRNREELYQFIRELPADLNNKQIFYHPRAGGLTTTALLDFFQDHFERHKKQIYRILD